MWVTFELGHLATPTHASLLQLRHQEAHGSHQQRYLAYSFCHSVHPWRHPPCWLRTSPSAPPLFAEHALTLAFSQFFLAESPRYLIKAGHPEKAAANLCWLRNLEPTHPYIEEELAATVIEINREREITFGLKGGKVARYFRGLWNEASAKVSLTGTE